MAGLGDNFDFDESWYSDNYKDVSILGVNPAIHYNKFGKILSRYKSRIHKKFLTSKLNSFKYGTFDWNGNSNYDAYIVNNNILDGNLQINDVENRFEILKNNIDDQVQMGDWVSRFNSYLPDDDTARLVFDNAFDQFDFKKIKFDDYIKINDGPLITVIIPAFNAEKTIEFSVRSILNQSWCNLEILIFDDCSTDRTLDVIKTLASQDKRIKFYTNANNVGPYVIKNLALMCANGDYITCHDADDISHPQRLEKHIQIFFSNFDSMKVSMLSLIRVSKEGRICRVTKTGKYTEDGILRASPISCMFKKKFLVDEIGGWDCVKAAGDSELIDRCEKVLGYEVPKYNILSMICLESEGSLTQDKTIGLNSEDNPRKIYVKSYRENHKSPAFNGYKSFNERSNNSLAPAVLKVSDNNILAAYSSLKDSLVLNLSYCNTKLYRESVKNLSSITSIRGIDALKDTIIFNKSFSTIEVAIYHIYGIDISYEEFCYLANFPEKFSTLFLNDKEKFAVFIDFLYTIYSTVGVREKELAVAKIICLNSSYGEKFILKENTKSVDCYSSNLVREKFDVILVGDWCKFGGPQKSMLHEIDALTADGLKVGVCHMQAFRFMETNSPSLNVSIQQYIKKGTVAYVSLDDICEVNLVVLRYPPILQFCRDIKSNWMVRNSIILANQSPHELDLSDVRYDVNTVNRNFCKVFSSQPLWAPMGPMVREILEKYLPSSSFTQNVPGIISFDKEFIIRQSFESYVPKILGRYSRDNVMKFPSNVDVLKQIYMADDDNYKVIMLGGLSSINKIVGDKLPSNWELIKYKGMPVKNLLKSVYFFVYFDNDQIVEAFGRSILEAIASGCMVILPHKYEIVFGPSALYCEPNNVSQTIDYYSNNPVEYNKKVNHCLRVAIEKFGYTQYLDFVKRFDGMNHVE